VQDVRVTERAGDDVGEGAKRWAPPDLRVVAGGADDVDGGLDGDGGGGGVGGGGASGGSAADVPGVPTGAPGDRPGRPTGPDEAPAGPTWAEAVRDTYVEVRAPMWRSLVAWSGSPDVADEAVAEAFAQLLRRGPEVRDPKAWAWRAAYKLAAGDLQRRRRREGPGDDVLDLLPGAVDRLPDDALDLVRALAVLSDQQRECIALVDVAGHTAPSAAAVLGTSAATVRVQLMRARRRLRALLAEHDPSSADDEPEVTL
jgi:DNA-directed RNA polymerase specialized sigma24 family protein